MYRTNAVVEFELNIREGNKLIVIEDSIIDKFSIPIKDMLFTLINEVQVKNYFHQYGKPLNLYTLFNDKDRECNIIKHYTSLVSLEDEVNIFPLPIDNYFYNKSDLFMISMFSGKFRISNN